MAGGDRAGGGSAQIREIAVVQVQRLEAPGPGREHHHHAGHARQAELGIVEEAGAHLDRETRQSRHERGLDVDLAVHLGEVHVQDRRHHDAAGGERRERAGDGVDDLGVELDAAPELVLGQDRERHAACPGQGARAPGLGSSPRISVNRRMSTLRPLSTTAISSPGARTLPASSAATPTAPPPSTICCSCQ